MSGIRKEPASGYSGPLVVVRVDVSMWMPDKSSREEHRRQVNSTPVRKEGGELGKLGKTLSRGFPYINAQC